MTLFPRLPDGISLVQKDLGQVLEYHVWDLDKDRQSGRFTVDSCRMEAKELGFSVTSLRSGDDYFENLKSQFDMDGSSGG